MIVITALPGKITVTGHAGCAPSGQDVVCAGVSVLVETLAASLEELTEDKFIYEVRSGRAVLDYYGTLSEGGTLLVESFFCWGSSCCPDVSQFCKDYRRCIVWRERPCIIATQNP